MMATIFNKRNIDKLFLVTFMFLGLLMSLLMPIFNEPDGQYHFAKSAEIANVQIDTSRYGEVNVITGMDGQKSAYQGDYHFKKYYLTKAVAIKSDKLPRDLTNGPIYDYTSHIVPAAGLWLGYHLYPSLGVMVTFARVFSVLFCGFALYFMIRKLKAGQLLFSIISLTPLLMNQFASLSYDATTQVVLSFFMMLLINIVYGNKVTRRDIINLTIACFLIYFVAKKNYILLYLLIPCVLYKVETKIRSIQVYQNKTKEVIKKMVQLPFGIKIGAFAILVAAFAFLSKLMTVSQGGLVVVIKRFVRTLMINDFSPWPGLSWVSPYPKFNATPFWVIAVVGIVITLVLLSEEKFVKSRSLSFLAVVIFILNFVGILYSYLYYEDNGSFSRTITGTQGRYFFPFVLLFIFAVSNKKIKSKVVQGPILIAGSFAVVTMLGALLIYNTIWMMYR